MDGLAETLVLNWLRSDDELEILDVNNRVAYLERRLFDDYEPSQYWHFKQRLDKWLANLDEDHFRQTLYKLVGHLFFVGRQEFESLCRAAFHGPITRWLIDRIDLQFTDPNAETKIADAVKRTWFCPVRGPRLSVATG
jgi:hypothetical protein